MTSTATHYRGERLGRLRQVNLQKQNKIKNKQIQKNKNTMKRREKKIQDCLNVLSKMPSFQQLEEIWNIRETEKCDQYSENTAVKMLPLRVPDIIFSSWKLVGIMCTTFLCTYKGIQG